MSYATGLAPIYAMVTLITIGYSRGIFRMLMKIRIGVAQGISGLYAGWSNSAKIVRPVCIVLLCLFLEGCTSPPAHEPFTLTLLEEWTNKSFSEARQQKLQQFTRETGIRVSLLPSPESASQKLALWKELLGTGASGPDVYGIDVIWPRILDEYHAKPRSGAQKLFCKEFAKWLSLQGRGPSRVGSMVMVGNLFESPARQQHYPQAGFFKVDLLIHCDCIVECVDHR